jgi:hypothetical protein
MATTTSTPTVRGISILHVIRGCHVWSDGHQQRATMRLTLPLGARLAIVDDDVDAHQLVQMGGPALRLPGPMRMSTTARVRFTRRGIYRLATKTVELPGAAMAKAPTKGPDNHLVLIANVT